MSKRVTLQDVAKTAGVTVSTAHKALHGQKGVSEKKRREILEVAASLGYVREQQAQEKNVRVAAVFPKPVHENKYFYRRLWQGIRERTQQLSSARFSVQEYMFEGAAAQQLELLEQLYREKAGELEALLTIIWNEREYTDLIDRFTQAGVKVFTVSADAPSSRRVSSIMTNPNRTGRLAAEFLGPRIPAEGRVVLIGTRRDTINHAQIVHGFSSEMQEIHPAVEIMELYESVQYPEKLCQTLIGLLRSFDDIRAVYANNARATAGLCKALNRGDISPDIQILGSECFAESAEQLKNGMLCGILDQNAYQQGFMGLSAVFDSLVLEKQVPPLCEICPALYLKNNLPVEFL